MFVQSSHFIEHEGGDTARKVVFYGQEKNRDTIRIATMNLAVHGLEGKIVDAITYYQDEHSLGGRCDFVMANPLFNVDLVDAERIKGDPRLPFGLPGVNKQKKVGNGNYLWISYFWSYLNETGRAGFVMSSQASSAGHGEKEVRRKLVETGDVDVMISIRSNFFYTRSVPCELWHLDRGKPPERRDKVLMLDARNVYRKVTRKIYDFSPEQTRNLAAIVWLYRGQRERFLGLVKDYLDRVCTESAAVPATLSPFEATLTNSTGALRRARRGGGATRRHRRRQEPSARRLPRRAARSGRALRDRREEAPRGPRRLRREVRRGPTRRQRRPARGAQGLRPTRGDDPRPGQAA
jgi:type I restriction enzyme M protein